MNSDDGVDLWSTTGMVTFENSWAFWNGFQPGLHNGNSDSYSTGGDGNGFKLGANATSTSSIKRRFTNNLAFQNSMYGYNDNNARCNIELYNNTSYGNCFLDLPTKSNCGGYWFSLSSSYAYYMINNITYDDVYGTTNNGIKLHANQSMTNIHHNSWTVGGVSSSDFASLSTGYGGATPVTSGAAGPRQSDGSLPALSLLHLASGSNLINAGTTISGFPMSCNGTCDLGAYEL
jgi:hypothetical protein